MHPTIAGTVQSYTVCLVFADLVGLAVAFMCAYRGGVPLRRFAFALLLVTGAAFAGAKVYGLIERGGALGTWQAELVSSYRYPGAVVAVAITALLLSRLPPMRLSAGTLLDLLAPAFGFALVVVRLGCFLAGCCNGSVSVVPWAIRFPGHSQLWHAQLSAGLIDASAPQSLPVHPLQLYFGALALTVGCAAFWLERRKRYAGQVFLLFVAAYGAGQFGLEFLRARPLPHVQYLCGALAITATTILVARGLARRRDDSQPRTMTEVRAMKSVMTSGLLVITWAFLPPAFGQESTAAQPVASDATGSGSLTLEVHGTAVESSKQVGVTVAPNAGNASLGGSAAVVGFPMIQNGEWAATDWKMNGTQITGTVRNRNGTTEGTFEGTITATGVSGKFTHVDGRVGLWSWNGPPPGATGQQ